ncbi:MAG: universal stress protein [Rhodococcus sp. (in: high G+C Gram-positive bacteria)]|uniref:universal stress protein n=1 Tax=Rhodococcus sp. TaxID=1831 RepID=UPI003BB04149
MDTAPIVVGVDGSAPSIDAVRWGTREALLRKTPLVLLSCAPRRGTEAVPRIGEELSARAERALADARVATEEQDPGGAVEIRTEVSEQDASAALIARSDTARMVVLGRRGLGEFVDGLAGSVSSAVAQHAHCPVVVIDGASQVDSGTGPVVVGVDGSVNSAAAVALAFEECTLRNAELVALHAWSDQDLSSLPLDTSEEDRRAAAVAENALLAESLAGWQEMYPDVTVRRIVVRDRPVRHLLEQADEAHAQSIIVGSRGRGGFEGMTLGSTSAALLHIAPCPLIIVRTEATGRTERDGSPPIHHHGR